MSSPRRFNLFGGGFQHTVGSTLHKKPRNISWDYNTIKNDTTFYVDGAIISGCNDKESKTKFGWILESKFVVDLEAYCFQNLKKLKREYKYIFTHNQFLISLDRELFKFSPANGTWIAIPAKHKKTKRLSMITSRKQVTPAQKFRVAYAEKNKSVLDLYGRGYREIENKEQGLEDYMFSVCIENGAYKTYYTEKILDCFACGTIPVYIGTPDIGDHFNKDGIIILSSQLNLSDLTEGLYYSKMKAIEENLEKIKKHYTVEDYIFEEFIK